MRITYTVFFALFCALPTSADVFDGTKTNVEEVLTITEAERVRLDEIGLKLYVSDLNQDGIGGDGFQKRGNKQIKLDSCLGEKKSPSISRIFFVLTHLDSFKTAIPLENSRPKSDRCFESWFNLSLNDAQRAYLEVSFYYPINYEGGRHVFKIELDSFVGK